MRESLAKHLGFGEIQAHSSVAEGFGSEKKPASAASEVEDVLGWSDIEAKILDSANVHS